MPLLSYIHFACMLSYVALSVLLLASNRRDARAVFASLLLLSLAIWSLGHTVTYFPYVSRRTAVVFGNVSACGWTTFGPFWVLFAAAFTDRMRLLRTPWLHAILWLPPAVFLYAQSTGQLFAGYEAFAYGWDGVWQRTPFTYAYYVFYLATALAGAVMVHRYGRASTAPGVRQSARLLVGSVLLILPLGTFSNVAARWLVPQRLPPVANILSLVWAGALFVSIVRYRMFQLVTQTGELRRANERLSNEIARREEIERELRESEERFRIVFECAPDACYLSDLTGTFVEGNRRAEEITGYSREELIGRSIMRLALLSALDLPRAGRLLAVNALGKPTGPDEFRLRRKDGSRVDVEILTYPVHIGEKSLVLGIARDVTARRTMERERDQLEQQRRQNEKLDALGQLAGGVAHDFNNMLGAIMGNAQLLQAELDTSNPELRRFVDRILEASHHSADLTAKLLTFSRRGASGMIRVDLNRTVSDVVDLLRHTIDRRVEVRTRLAKGETTVMGDPAQLANVVMNLALNARDAMPEGGVLSFATGHETVEPSPRHGSAPRPPAGPCVSLTVADTGTGMKQHVLDHLFDPFFTTKEIGKGTGLGLASVYGTVESHRGRIAVKSAPGRGTTFRILLPAAPQQQDTAPARPEGHGALPGTGTVLVVDDEQLVRDMCEDVLRTAGYQSVLCSTGAEALAYVGEGGRADVILLDLNMPQMSGRCCYEKLRSLAPQLPVVVATGYADSADVAFMQTQGVELVRKPFEASELVSALNRSMGRRDDTTTAERGKGD